MRSQDALGLLVTAAVLALDQLSKAVVSHQIGLHESIALIPGLLNLTHVRNTGAAFGILSSQPSLVRSLILLASSLLAAGFILWIWFRQRNTSWSRTIPLGMILGGALGNMLDRVRLGEVIDFLDLYWGRYHWPAFNVADSAITVGILLFLPALIMPHRDTPTRPPRGCP